MQTCYVPGTIVGTVGTDHTPGTPNPGDMVHKGPGVFGRFGTQGVTAERKMCSSDRAREVSGV